MKFNQNPEFIFNAFETIRGHQVEKYHTLNEQTPSASIPFPTFESIASETNQLLDFIGSRIENS